MTENKLDEKFVEWLELREKAGYNIRGLLHGYQELILIVKMYFARKPKINNSLNYFYERFADVVENSITVYSYKHVFELDYDYRISSDYYKPFTNLFLAEEEMKKNDLTQASVLEKMNQYYGLLHKKFYDQIPSIPKSAELETLLDGFRNHFPVPSREVTDTEARLIFNLTDGTTTVIAAGGKKYSAKFGTQTNNYLLLQFLALNKGVNSIGTLAKKLKQSDKSTDDRRVRDTIKAIKDKLKLSKEDNIFTTDSGFGLNCTVALES